MKARLFGRRHREQALTLIEVMISLGLLAIVALALFEFFGTVSRDQSSSRMLAARDEIVRRIRAAAGSIATLRSSAVIPGIWGTGVFTNNVDGKRINSRLRSCIDIATSPAEVGAGYENKGCMIPGVPADNLQASNLTTTANATTPGEQDIEADVILFPPSPNFTGLVAGVNFLTIDQLLSRAVAGPWSGIVRLANSGNEVYARTAPPWPSPEYVVRYDQNANFCTLTAAPGANSATCPLMAGARFRAKCRSNNPATPGQVSGPTAFNCATRVDTVEIEYWVGLRQDYPQVYGGPNRIAAAYGRIPLTIDVASIVSTVTSTTATSTSTTATSTSTTTTGATTTITTTTSSTTSTTSTSTTSTGPPPPTGCIVCTFPFFYVVPPCCP